MAEKKWTSAGGVVLEKLEEPYQVYVVKPSNNFAPWCFPKGKVDEGETLHAAALREVEEEAGISAEMIPGANLGVGVGRYSITHYFLMLKRGELGSHDEETEEVRLLSLDDARRLFSSVGNSRDVGILEKARAFLAKQDEKKEVKEVRKTNGKRCSNMLESIFFATCVSKLIGENTNVKLRGTENEIEAVGKMVSAASNFREELSRPGATVNSIMRALATKQEVMKEFKRIVGIPWLL